MTLDRRPTTRESRRAWARTRPGGVDLVVLAAAVVAVGLITADVMAGGWLTHVDETVRNATIPAGGAPTWTRGISVMGNIAVGGGVVLVAAIVTMQISWRWWPGVVAVATFASTGVTVLVLKAVVGRSGPKFERLPDGYLGYFPAGHTAIAAVSIGTVVFLVATWHGGRLVRARRLGVIVGAVAGVTVATSSVLGGFHWFTDVVASLVIATAAMWVGFSMAVRYADHG